MSLIPGTLGAVDDRPAVVEPGHGAISYADLDRLASAVSERLTRLGVPPGGRVGLYLRRSSDTIAAMLGALRAGCAYVPIDPFVPAERVVEILMDCRVHATFVEQRLEPAYRDALARAGGSAAGIQTLGALGLGRAIGDWAFSGNGSDRVERGNDDTPRSDLACLMYTSGTTGRPKGWMMNREAVDAHARWCHHLLAPTREDVFANHAPFSFGISIFDIYSSLACGSPLVLVPDEIRQHGRFVADLMARERVSIWFSGPAILSLLGQLDDLEARDLSALRVVAFAGEVFPLPQLNALRRRLPQPRYFNFYGSTEMNVATFYELPRSGDLDDRPPMGHPCAHYDVRIVGENGEPSTPAAPGELQVRGAGLMTGYWNTPNGTDTFIPSADGGKPWFRTGDLAVTLPSGDLRYAGRIGRMVKLRGYRVEPGEIEARLYQHASIKEAGVVLLEGTKGPELVAHVATTTGERLPVVALREFCAIKLPAYMIPARFEFHASLPKTSSGKIDIQTLRAMQGAVSTP